MKKGCFKGGLILLFMVTILCSSGFSKDKYVTSTWAPAPPKIDGLSQDWEETPLLEQKYGVKLGVRNDDKYFYVLFVFTNPRYLTSVEQTGMTIYFDQEGKKNKHYGINFRRLRLTADEFIATMEEKQGPMPEAQKQQIRANKFYSVFHYGIISKGFEEVLEADEGGAILPAVFRVQQQQKMVFYEFAVPIERATNLAPGIGSRAGENIKVGFEWGGWSKELKRAVASRMGVSGSRARDERASDDISGEGGNPRGERGMRMGDAPGIAAMRRRQPKKYTFWMDVKLAEK